MPEANLRELAVYRLFGKRGVLRVCSSRGSGVSRNEEGFPGFLQVCRLLPVEGLKKSKVSGFGAGEAPSS